MPNLTLMTFFLAFESTWSLQLYFWCVLGERSPQRAPDVRSLIFYCISFSKRAHGYNYGRYDDAVAFGEAAHSESCKRAAVGKGRAAVQRCVTQNIPIDIKKQGVSKAALCPNKSTEANLVCKTLMAADRKLIFDTSGMSACID